MHTDTIAAISTPPGRGGIGIVRLSGPDSLRIALKQVALHTTLPPGRARFAQILDHHGHVLDEAVITYFQAPASYTTEDVVELATHSAPVLLDHILQACIQHGARLAHPGEFTQRAFLAGRLDLTQAEAVHDLIQANTLHQARIAAAQLGGSLSRTVAPIKQSLIQLIATLEAGVDFAEDDIDVLPAEEIALRIAELHQPLAHLAETWHYGRILRTGFTLALIGRPNAGKSSLFNRLLARDRAIVTPQPGTTRDSITETFSLAGIPVHLIDTAGLRDQPDSEAERQGIARTRTAIAEADLILEVLSPAEPPAPGALSSPSLATVPPEPPPIAYPNHLTILNKSDLPHPPTPYLEVSALTGHNIPALQQLILTHITQTPPPESTIVTNLRQHTHLAESLAALTRASQATQLPHELILLDLYAALESLDQLTGATTADTILNLIFSTFCIGK